MSSRNALTRPTDQELENARTKGQVIGWIQGVGAMLLLGVVLKLIGWIPLIVGAGLVLMLGFKVLFGRKKS